MSCIKSRIKTLEKLSLVTCTDEVLVLLERTLSNVKPILSVDTKSVQPMIWQNRLDVSRLHKDEPAPRLSLHGLKQNAPNCYEDYIAIGKPRDIL